MIEQFKEIEARNSGVIFKSTLDQIKKLYEADPELAGELAISAIELVLCGEISSDDMMIGILLEPARAVNKNNQDKYDTKVEAAKVKKMTEMRLDKIAELVNSGKKQREIGEALGMSQQTVSYRISLIKTKYPELLISLPQGRDEERPAAQKNAPAAQTNSITYKNTKVNKNENFVKIEEEEETEVQVKRPFFDF